MGTRIHTITLVAEWRNRIVAVRQPSADFDQERFFSDLQPWDGSAFSVALKDREFWDVLLKHRLVERELLSGLLLDGDAQNAALLSLFLVT